MKFYQIALCSLVTIALASCHKHDTVTPVTPPFQVDAVISNTSPLVAGNYHGTMLANQTYTVSGTITVPTGDTLLLQSGVKLNMAAGANVVVKGTLLSLGTKTAPVTITDPARTATTGSSTAATDSAYKGGWGGIYASSSCPLLVIKWTHLNFGGTALTSATVPFSGPSTGDQYIIYFGNPTGNFIFEDSWVYGTPDDVARINGGHINIMRNTLEKCGDTTGDGFNIKGSTIGNVAYNMTIGAARNGVKISNDNAVSGIQTQVAIYNNTYVNCGYRSTDPLGEKGGSIEMQNGAIGLAYNNIIADCAIGMRVDGGTDTTAKVFMADTTLHTTGMILKTAYGYNFYYADIANQAGQFVPTNVEQAVITHPQTTGIPNMALFLGPTYTFGFAYNGSTLVNQNNPSFNGYPFPNLNYAIQASVDAYSFHLNSGSTAIGIGYTGFTQIENVPVSANFGSSGITPPGKDAGCYQSNGTGNQH